MGGILSPEPETPTEFESVKIFKNAQEAIDAVQKDHAVGVYEDTYMDQDRPNYLVFYDHKRFQEFEKTLTNLRKEPGGSFERGQLFDKLKDLAGSSIEPGSLKWIYRSEWAITPDNLLLDEDSIREQQEDDEFFTAQKVYFEPESIEQRRSEWEVERERQKQIWLESGSDEDDDPDPRGDED